MALRVDIVAELNERAATAAANRLKGQMIRAGEVSGEAFRAALEKEAQRSKIATDKLQAELRSQFTKHGEHAGTSFGTGFGSQMVRSLPGVSGFTSAMAGYEGAAAKSGALAGRALGMAFTTAAGGLMGAAAYTLFKGFERYETIDAATRRLQNLSKTMQAAGQTGLDVAAIMKTVNDVVLGTPIGLDKAMGAVTVALGSGVKQGDELKRYLTDIADAAGYSGRSFEEIALVFGQVQAKGRLMGEEVLQLAEKNIPAAAWLKDTFKLTGDEYERMQEKGQISLKALEMAIEQHAGGQAKAMGETIQGAISNVQSSISRTGANFLAAIFGKPTDQNNTMVEALKSIKDRLDEVGAWVVAHQEEIHNFFKNAAETARELGRVLGDVLRYLGEHEGAIKAVVVAFGAWKAIDGVASLITSLKTISTFLGVTLPTQAAASAAAISASFAAIVLPPLLTAGDAPGSKAETANDKQIAGNEYFKKFGKMPPGYQQWLQGSGPMPQELAPFFRPGAKPGDKPPMPTPTPWSPGPGMPTYHWDWAKGGWVDDKGNRPGPGGAPAPGLDNSNPFLPPRDKGNGEHLPKAPVVPYDTALPPGFENLPMSSGLYSAESSYLDSRHKLAEKRARLAQLENDATATEQDRLDARNDVITADRDLQQSELRLYEERAGIFTKHNKQIKTWLSELGDIGAALDKDFGISKGLAGIAENITKFIASIAAAPMLGRLAATQMVAGYKPGEAGSGLMGMMAGQGAFGPQYQIPGSITQAMAKAGGGALNWDALAAKESGGNWAANTGNGYFGGLQFDLPTWKAYKPAGAPDNPALATREQQIAAGMAGIQARGGPQSLWPQNWQQLGSGGGGGGGPLGLTGGGLAAMFGGAGYSTGGGIGGGIPYGLPAGSNSGGYGGAGVQFPDWVNALGAAFGVKPSTYGGHQENNRIEAGYAPNPQLLNRGIDWSGSVENMQRFAEYVSSVPGMEQVIWQNPGTGQRIGIAGGRDVSGTGYYAGDYGDHQNHVHTRQATSIPLPGGMMPAGFGGGAGDVVLPGGGGGLGVQAAGFGQGGGVGGGLGGGGGASDVHGWGGGAPGPGLPGMPYTANPTRIGGVAPPQGKGGGFGGLGGLPMAAIGSAISAAGMAGDAFAPGGGQAAAAAAQSMLQLVNRAIGFAGQAAGIGVQGLMETFLPAGSELANNNWLTKIAGGVAGATLALPNLAGKGNDDGSGPTPEQVVGQGQGIDGRPAGLPDPAAPAGNTDNSKNVTNNLTIQAAPAQNENSMGNTVTSHLAEMYST
ncbi:transglycosylase family protein [Mycobacterium paragordonae]|uniref:transglycosylase family protein n=1 Tax=Mycobacterium paragordonae TaxID=1389713 RepID=UPI0023EA5045|nr:transglycosylase family protein [Mycobacterium paragordonae]